MTPGWEFAFLLLALVSFALAAANVPARLNFIGLGLLFWVAVPLVDAARAL